MKRLFALAAAAIVAVGFATQAQAERLSLQFLGKGAVISFEDALKLANVSASYDKSAGTLFGKDVKAIVSGATCFTANMRLTLSGQSLGTGIDCLVTKAINDGGPGINVQALSLFIFDGRGKRSIVTLGKTSVRPFIKNVGDASGGVTHMTGSIPSADGSGDGIIGGSGKYAKATGTVRVSGAMDLSKKTGAPVVFDCLWLLEVQI